MGSIGGAVEFTVFRYGERSGDGGDALEDCPYRPDASARWHFVPDRVLFEQRQVPLAKRENRGWGGCVDCRGM